MTLPSPPSLFSLFLPPSNAGSGANVSTRRTGIAAGSPVPIDLMKQLIEKLNLTELTVAYGMSTYPAPFFPAASSSNASLSPRPCS